METKSYWYTNKWFIACLLIGVVAYFMLTELPQHLYEWLPFLLLALCPLMHIFMHGSHGSHHGEDFHGHPQAQLRANFTHERCKQAKTQQGKQYLGT